MHFILSFGLLLNDDDGFWGITRFFFSISGLAVAGMAHLIYPIARITLNILSFTSLHSLSSSAFDTISWVDLVPFI